MTLADRLRELAGELEIVPLTASAVDTVAARLRNIARQRDLAAAPVATSTCSGPTCKRPIVWGKLGGKPHPLDPQILAVVTADGHVVRGRQSHYATCPDAEEFRR